MQHCNKLNVCRYKIKFPAVNKFSFENATQQVNSLIYIKQLTENVLHISHVLKLYYPHQVHNYGLSMNYIHH
jgi:hypothetical protein